MKIKNFVLLFFIFLLITAGCEDPVEEYINQIEIANQFSDFMPEFAEIITGEEEDFPRQAEEALASVISMEIDIDSAHQELTSLQNNGNFSVHIMLTEVDRVEFINLFTDTKGEEVPDELYSEWENLHDLLNQEIAEVNVFYQETSFSEGSKFNDDNIDNIINSDRYAGGLIGRNAGVVIDSYSKAVVSGSRNLGGLIGYNESTALVARCYAEGEVISEDYYVGGLVGRNYGMITECYATGDVSTESSDVGGLIGHNGGIINNSYATGNVNGWYSVGGLVGFNSGVGSQDGIIDRCYALGLVTAESEEGGLVGEDSNGDISRSYYDKETTGQEDTGKGAPKSTESMQIKSTFEDWDFDSVWRINEEIYPNLQWE